MRDPAVHSVLNTASGGGLRDVPHSSAITFEEKIAVSVFSVILSMGEPPKRLWIAHNPGRDHDTAQLPHSWKLGVVARQARHSTILSLNAPTDLKRPFAVYRTRSSCLATLLATVRMKMQTIKIQRQLAPQPCSLHASGKLTTAPLWPLPRPIRPQQQRLGRVRSVAAACQHALPDETQLTH